MISDLRAQLNDVKAQIDEEESIRRSLAATLTLNAQSSERHHNEEEMAMLKNSMQFIQGKNERLNAEIVKVENSMKSEKQRIRTIAQ